MLSAYSLNCSLRAFNAAFFSSDSARSVSVGSPWVAVRSGAACQTARPTGTPSMVALTLNVEALRKRSSWMCLWTSAAKDGHKGTSRQEGVSGRSYQTRRQTFDSKEEEGRERGNGRTDARSQRRTSFNRMQSLIDRRPLKRSQSCLNKRRPVHLRVHEIQLHLGLPILRLVLADGRRLARQRRGEDERG